MRRWDTDRLHAKNLFWMDHLPDRSLALTAGLLAAAGLAAAGWGHPCFLVPVGSTLLLGWAYCLRPLRLSRRWGWDALANVLGYGVLAPWLGALLVVPVQGANGWIVAGRGFPTAAVLHLAPLVLAGFLLAGHHHALAEEVLYSVGFTHTWAVFPLVIAALIMHIVQMMSVGD